MSESTRGRTDTVRTRLLTLVALAAAAAYALPLLAPPPGVRAAPLAPDATLLERLFPGVPGSWVLARLACAFAAMALVAWVRRGVPIRSTRREARAESEATVGGARLRWAVLAAVLQVLAGLWASSFNRIGQLLYAAWFAVPAMLLVRWRRLRPSGRAALTTVLLAIIAFGWVVLRLPASWQSPRSADILDTWVGLELLSDAAHSSFNLLTDRSRPGSGSFHMIAQGAPFAALLGVQLDFGFAQVMQFAWLAVVAVAVGLLAARLWGRAAACVATAALLFSPYTQMMVLTPLPFFFYPVVTAGLLILVVAVRDNRSPAALVGLGALAGIGATLHSANFISVAVLAFALLSAVRFPLPRRVLLVAGLSFAAAIVTTVVDFQQLGSMINLYTRGRAQWVGPEMAALGQTSAVSSEYTVEAAIRRPLDTVASSLLSPLAMPRTAMRDLGDTLFDPIGSALSLIGIAACLAALRTGWLAPLLLTFVLLGVLPGAVSSSDRVSVNRLLVLPVPMAVLAGLGWEVLRQSFGRLARSAVATAAVVVGVAAGGTMLVDEVNPAILAESWQSLALSALADAVPAGGAVLLDHPAPRSFPWWRLDDIVRVIPRPRLGVKVYDRPESLLGEGTEQPVAELILWSPGLEDDQRVSTAICERWPRAVFFTLSDEPRISRTFVAAPEGTTWAPALPADRWRREDCTATLETERTWAAAVLARAKTDLAAERKEGAVESLRAAARRNIGQADLFEATARVLLDNTDDPARIQEAVHWARRACQVTRFRDPRAAATLAAAYAAAGDPGEAARTAADAEKEAIARGDDALAADLARRAREYAEAAARGKAP